MRLHVVFTQLLFALALQITSLNSFSQNVGIGTTTPSEKLEIKNPLRSTVKLTSNNYLDTTELLLSNRNALNQGTDFSIKSIREEGLAFSSLSDLANNTSLNSLVIKTNGNVGINTYAPTHRFEVTGASYFNGNVGVGVPLPSNKFEVSGNSYFNGNVGVGVPSSGNKFEVTGTSVFNGMVGLGATPSVRLEISGAIKLQGTNTFEFGSGIAGKEANAGKIGYQVFTADALDIVGGGTNPTNRKVKLWAEGGTIISGPVSIGGALQINGDPGVAGRVLTSNGTGAPQWKTTSFSNTARFAVTLSGSFTTSFANVSSTIYNQNPTDITIGGVGVTINHAGLYHFDVEGIGSVGFASTTTAYPSFSLWLSFGTVFSVMLIDDLRMENTSNSYSNSYKCSRKESIEIYVSAPTVIQVNYGFSASSVGAAISSTNFTGFFSGHLISD